MGLLLPQGHFYIEQMIHDTVEIVRMSVQRNLRRQGIGNQMLRRLCDEAYRSGYKRVILETTETWQEVIEFYKSFGFQITCFKDGDVYFSLDLHNHF